MIRSEDLGDNAVALIMRQKPKPPKKRKGLVWEKDKMRK